MITTIKKRRHKVPNVIFIPYFCLFHQNISHQMCSDRFTVVTEWTTCLCLALFVSFDYILRKEYICSFLLLFYACTGYFAMQSCDSNNIIKYYLLLASPIKSQFDELQLIVHNFFSTFVLTQTLQLRHISFEKNHIHLCFAHPFLMLKRRKKTSTQIEYSTTKRSKNYIVTPVCL